VQQKEDQQVKMLTDTLLSRPNFEKLVQQGDLEKKGVSGADRNKLIDELSKGIQLSRSEKDNLFLVSYRNTEPTRAKQIVDSLLSMLLESGVNNRRGDTNNAMAFLDGQIRDYEAVLKAAEGRLKAFKLQNLDYL